jgi:thiol:disulfide interchange protein DsbD
MGAIWLTIALLTWGGMLSAQASSPKAPSDSLAKAKHLIVKLVANVSSVKPGTSFWVGVHQIIDEHWHTYWQNPGDSGTVPAMKWTLPPGVTISKAHWPIPERIKVAHLANFGYSHEVLLLYRVKVPKTVSVTPFSLKGTFSWLVCKGECIPGSATLALSLPIDTKQPQPSASQNLFTKYLARLPQSVPPLQAKARVDGDHIKIQIPTLPTATKRASCLQIFPITPSVVLNAKPPKQTKQQTGLSLRFEKNEYFEEGTKRVDLLLIATHQPKAGQTQTAYRVRAMFPQAPTSRPVVAAVRKPTPRVAATSKQPTNTRTQPAQPITRGLDWYIQRAQARKARFAATNAQKGPDFGFWQALFFALLGGLLLNLMPCVFPVLSIKIMHFVEQSKEDKASIRAHGLAFSGGVVVSFLLLAGLLLALKASGESIGWGFQLQSPLFIWLLLMLMFAMGLSLSGVFEIGTSLMSTGSGLADKGGYVGSFFTGVLATVVATPCTAPLMAPAIGWALSQTPLVGLSIFASLGMGMALPYTLLAFFPGGLKWLPKPGAWMETFKQVMAFPMYATAIWLLWVLGKQAGPEGMITASITLVLLSMALWLFGRTRFKKRQRLGTIATLLLLLGTWGWGGLQLESDVKQASQQRKEVAQLRAQVIQRKTAPFGTKIPFTRNKLDHLLQQKQHVFLNMTAAWCISCKVNERVALSQQSVKQAFQRNRVHYVSGDWTNKDPAITRVLQQFKRSGVPIYIVFNGKQGTFEVLPQVLTPGIVTRAVDQLSK